MTMNALSRIFSAIAALFETESAEIRTRDAYFNEATSIVDLEMRMRDWDKRPAQNRMAGMGSTVWMR